MSKPPIPAGRRLLRLLEMGPTAVVAFGARGRIVYANAAWQTLTGCEIEDALGRQAGEATNATDRVGAVVAAFDPPPEAWGGRPTSARVGFPGPALDPQWCRVDYWPLGDPGGRHALILGIVGPDERPGLADESPNAKLRAELTELRARLGPPGEAGILIGRGPVHRRMVTQVKAIAVSRANAILLGPRGSGRRFAAEAVHRAKLVDRPLLLIDCEAVPADGIMIAVLQGLGTAETLILHECAALTRDAQLALVEALGDGERPRAQVISTCREDPEAAVSAGTLRADLYLELSTVMMRLPALRERLDDLPLLARHFLEAANSEEEALPRRGFATGALEILGAYDWPGNLAELRRVIQAGHRTAQGDLIRPVDWPAEVRGSLAGAYPPPPVPEPVLDLRANLEAHERQLIERALQVARRNKSRAAQLLGLSRATLIRRVKDLEIDDPSE